VDSVREVSETFNEIKGSIGNSTVIREMQKYVDEQEKICAIYLKNLELFKQSKYEECRKALNDYTKISAHHMKKRIYRFWGRK